MKIQKIKYLTNFHEIQGFDKHLVKQIPIILIYNG